MVPGGIFFCDMSSSLPSHEFVANLSDSPISRSSFCGIGWLQGKHSQYNPVGSRWHILVLLDEKYYFGRDEVGGENGGSVVYYRWIFLFYVVLIHPSGIQFKV